MERGLEGGQRPHNRPLSPARRAQGESHEKKERKRENAGCSRKEQGSGESPTPVEVGGNVWAFPLYSSPSVAIPCALRAGQARGLLWETCGFPPPRPLLATSPGIPLPFQSRTSPRPPDVLVFQQKLRFRNTRTCRHGIAWRVTPKPHVMPTPFPPYGPAGGSGVLRSCPHP